MRGKETKGQRDKGERKGNGKKSWKVFEVTE
jgi:hypothetical protein